MSKIEVDVPPIIHFYELVRETNEEKRTILPIRGLRAK